MKTNLLIAFLFVATSIFAQTPTLKDAVMAQNYEKTKAALDAGANPNEQWSSAPALYWAATTCGRGDIMKLLLEKGAAVDGVGPIGITPLGGICNDPKTPQMYVDENIAINAKVLKRVKEEDAKAKGWLRETDISVFSTPVERARILLQAGADPNFLLGNLTVKEWTPFLTVVDKQNIELVKVLLESKKVDTEIRFHQWAEGAAKFANYLNAEGYSDLSQDDAQKWAERPTFNTPLLFAIEKNNLELVTLLVENGANLYNGKKIQEKTATTTYLKYMSPLDWAIKHNHLEIIAYLQTKNAIRYQK